MSLTLEFKNKQNTFLAILDLNHCPFGKRWFFFLKIIVKFVLLARLPINTEFQVNPSTSNRRVNFQPFLFKPAANLKTIKIT